VDPALHVTMADLSLSEEARDLWEPALPHLSRALTGSETPFLDALEAAGRGVGLTQKMPVTDLLDAYSCGSEAVRERLLGGGGDRAVSAARRLLALEHVALTRVAAGYSGGLTETIERLRRLAEESSPLDGESGAIKPGELGDRLSLEVERCQRMDLPLGLLGLAIDGHGEARPSARPLRSDLHQIGACLRENLRRYDSVGLTGDGAFVLVLPDISRRGLAGAAERLRRELGSSCGGHGESPALIFALAHYDFVDVNAQEMLSVLGRSLHHAREAHQSIAWA
jgi:hypothetical protein